VPAQISCDKTNLMLVVKISIQTVVTL